MVCTYDHVDQAADPLAGLESNNPFLVMMSRLGPPPPLLVA
jgi:hypothetical protein